MGFAIPINSVRPILQSLIEKGKVIRAYLGVGVLDRDMAYRYGYDFDEGVYIARIEKNGLADQADMRVGDIIVKVNKQTVNSVADLRSILDDVPVGSTVSIEIIRNGRETTVHSVLKEMPN